MKTLCRIARREWEDIKMEFELWKKRKEYFKRLKEKAKPTL